MTRTHVTASLIAQGVSPPGRAGPTSRRIAQGGGSARTGAIPAFVQLDFAYATRSVLMVMGWVMVGAAVVALVGLRRGVQTEVPASAVDVAHNEGQ